MSLPLCFIVTFRSIIITNNRQRWLDMSRDVKFQIFCDISLKFCEKIKVISESRKSLLNVKVISRSNCEKVFFLSSYTYTIFMIYLYIYVVISCFKLIDWLLKFKMVHRV